MVIIGFTGPAGCGKDTAAMALVRTLGFTRLSFATPIKQALDAMFGWHPGNWEDREWKETINLPFSHSPRRLAQTLGTEWGRNLDPDLWLKLMERQLHEVTKKGSVQWRGIVIPDVRFPNEATWIHSHGGQVIDVTRILSDKVATHSSEDGLTFEHIDYNLANAGGVVQLEAEVVALVKELI